MFLWIVRAVATSDDDEFKSILRYIDMPNFIKEFQLLWEKVYSIETCSYNVHFLGHILHQRIQGPMTATSAFPFEGLFSVMLRSLVPGTRSTTKQAHVGAYANYKAGRNGHACKKRIKYAPVTRNCSDDDSLIYTETGFWKITSIPEPNVYECKRVRVMPWEVACKHGVQGKLKMSLVGAYQYAGTDENDTSIIQRCDIKGKLIHVSDYILKIPKDILYEST